MSCLKNIPKIRLKLSFGVRLCASSSNNHFLDPFAYKPEYKKYEKEWLEIENNRRKKLIILPDNPKEDLKLQYPLRIGGTDVSYKSDPTVIDKYRQTEAFACYVVLEYLDEFQNEPSVIYEDYLKYIPDVPYVPGFLGIRESEPVTRLIKRQMKCYPKLTPHCVMVDGNGLLHFRKFGIACHIGVLTDLPTIGISKDHWRYPSRPCNAKEIRTIQRNKVKELKKAGDFQEISHPDDPKDIVGISLRTVDKPYTLSDFVYAVDNSNNNDYYKYLLSLAKSKNYSKKAMYISVGHKISLLKSKELVLRTVKPRKININQSICPEPTRLADELSRKSIKGIHNDGFLRPNILAVNYNEWGIPIINNKTNKSL